MSKSIQQGFTLVELVSVIVILGILAAVAIPKYIDLSTQAQSAAVQGVAGSLSAAAAYNFLSKQANSTNYVSISSCSGAGNLLQAGLPSTAYTISATPTTTVTSGATQTCTLQYAGQSATFIIVGA